MIMHQNKDTPHLLLCHGKVVPRLIKDNPHAKNRKEAISYLKNADRFGTKLTNTSNSSPSVV